MKIYLILFILLTAITPLIAQTDEEDFFLNEAIDFINKQEYESAFEILTKGIDETIGSAHLYDMRGILLESLGFYDEAIADFSAGIENTEDDQFISHLLSNRGGSKYRIRDFEGAYNDLVSSLKLNLSNIDALNNLAATCEEINRKDEALKYLKQIILYDSTYVPAYVNLGFTYQRMEEHEKAITYFDKAIELGPEEALGYSNRAFSKLNTGDLTGAMTDINQSIELFPTNSYAYKVRALVEIENEHIANACEDLNKAISLGYTRQYGEEVNQLKLEYCK